jgi:hypothetical protein
VAGTSRRDRRPAPGVTVLALELRDVPVAGYLLRHGPAVTVVRPRPDEGELAALALAPMGIPPMGWADAPPAAAADEAERALEATAHAGFDVLAVERGRAADAPANLRELGARHDVAVTVVGTVTARRARALARTTGAPVLVLPSGAAAAGGPAVMSAQDAELAAPAAARALATEDAVVVAAHHPVPAGTVVRTAGAPVVAGRLAALAEELRLEELDAAHAEADAGAEAAAAAGLRPEPVVVAAPLGPAAVAAGREGLLVVADHGGRRAPAGLRDALRERRPVLVVPAPAVPVAARPARPAARRVLPRLRVPVPLRRPAFA